MSEPTSETSPASSGPNEDENIPQIPDEAGPQTTVNQAGPPEEPERSNPDEEPAPPAEEQPEEQPEERVTEEETPNGHLKINLTIGDNGRTTVGIKRHDTDLVMTTIFTSEPEEVLKQVPQLIAKAEVRWSLEKMNPAYNRSSKSSKAKTQTNQNRNRPNPVSAPATRQPSSEAIPPPEAETPAEPQAQPIRLF